MSAGLTTGDRPQPEQQNSTLTRSVDTPSLSGSDTPPAWSGSAPCVLGIDLEDYFHVAAFRRHVRTEDWDYYPSRVEVNVEKLLDLLDRHQARATFFVLGWEAERRPRMVRSLAERGHELACHSYSHRELFELSPSEFRADTQRAKSAIEQAIGAPVYGYRAPSFSIRESSLYALTILAELGFRYDSSIFPVYHPNYGIPSASPYPYQIETAAGPLWEFPPATTRLLGRRIAVAGGAYLRHLPFPLVRWGIARLTQAERHPAFLYIHPWELDPDQPRLACDWVTRLRHYRNLNKTEQRLSRLLDSFPFATAAEVTESLSARRGGGR